MTRIQKLQTAIVRQERNQLKLLERVAEVAEGTPQATLVNRLMEKSVEEQARLEARLNELKA